MDNDWIVKSSIAAGLCALAMAFLVWTVGGWATEEEIAAYDARTVTLEKELAEAGDDSGRDRAQRALDDHRASPKVAAPGWAKVFPGKKISLGLDLQGGIELELRVDLLKALEVAADRYGQDLVEVLKAEGLEIEAKRVPGTAEIAVFVAPDKVEQVRKVIAERMVDVLANRGLSDVEGRQALVYGFAEAYAEHARGTARDQAVETIRNRVDKFGVSEPSILLKGQDRITVQLPGLDDPQRAINLIGRTAQLEFRMLYKEGEWNDLRVRSVVEQAVASANLGELYSDEQLARALDGRIPADASVMFRKEYDDVLRRSVRKEPYLVSNRVELTGELIEFAQVSNDEFNVPGVRMDLNPAGAEIFAELSGNNVGKRMAIVLDGTVTSAPVFESRIAGGSARITMGDQSNPRIFEEAQDLVLVLRAGALPAPIEIEHNRTVGKTLGDDSIRAGLYASALAGVLVLGFMWMYYGAAGLIANIAVLLNMLLLAGGLAAFDATLTLPGIGGMILTAGMAVDANVIINERIREELRTGKGFRAAVAAGYDRATSSIVDANLTTFLSGAVLYSYGTGPIRGFALTLMLGLATSVFSGLVITHLIFDYLARGRKVESLSIGIKV